MQGPFGGYSRGFGWLPFYILEDRVGPAGEGSVALSQLLRGELVEEDSGLCDRRLARRDILELWGF